jgi:hypothetical protein
VEGAPAFEDSADACALQELEGDALVHALCEEFIGAYELEGREKLAYRLQQLMNASVFPLEPAEAEKALEVWQLAEAYNFPRLEVPDYAVIEAGKQAWTEALWCMAGTPAVALAREALLQRTFHLARERAGGTQASLFGGGIPPA